MSREVSKLQNKCKVTGSMTIPTFILALFAVAGGSGVLQIFVSSPYQYPEQICIELPSDAMVNDLKTAIAEKGLEVGVLAIGGEPLTEGALSDSGISSETVIENTAKPVIFTAVAPIDGRVEQLVVKSCGLMRSDMTTQQIIDKMIQAINNEFGEFDAMQDEIRSQIMSIVTHVAEDQLNAVVRKVLINHYPLDHPESHVIKVRFGCDMFAQLIDLSRVRAKDLQLLLSGNLTAERLAAYLYP